MPIGDDDPCDRGPIARVLALVILTACGRFGFAPHVTSDDAAVDVGLDAAIPFVPAAGVLDPTFGATAAGYTLTTTAAIDCKTYAVTPRGAGYLAIGVHGDNSTSHFGLFAFTDAGAADPTFGPAGIRDVGPTQSDYGYGFARIDPQRLALTGDGDDGTNTTHDDTTIGLVDDDGVPLASFGAGDGFVRLDLQGLGRNDTSSNVAVVGTSLVSCATADYNGANARFALARVDLAGAPVASWGTNGLVLDDFQANVQDECLDVVARPGGGVFAAGRSGRALVIAAYDDTGARVSSFGTNGALVVANNTDAYAYAIALVDNDVVVGGESNGTSILVRVDATTGQPRATFGSNGIATFPAIDMFEDLAVQPDGALVGVGLFGNSAILARILASGALDPTFATDGIASLGFANKTELTSVIVTPGGPLVAIGMVHTTPITSLLARWR